MKYGYEVLWLPAAKSQLAALWTTVADRSSVAEAADRLDSLLRTAAPSAGESRKGNERIVLVRPLAAFVEVDAERRRVLVRAVRRL